MRLGEDRAPPARLATGAIPSKVRGLFLNIPVTDWETLYKAIAFGYRGEMVLHDTS